MKEEYDHLILPFIPGEIPRKKIPRGGGLKGRDDKTAFYQQELHELEGIQRNYREQKQRYGKYFNPNLIFKIEITQTLDENTLRLEFMRMGIDIISSSPDSKGYWIVFAEDDDFTEFKNKLKKYYTEDRYKFFNAIGKPISIPPNEKKGELLRENPFGVDEKSYLDIEIWRMDNGNLHKFLNGFNKLIEENGGEITDELTTNNFCLLRIMVNKILYESIMDLREVAHVNRPPKVKLELDKSLQIDLSELGTIEKPSNDATGILLVDSGILSGHPLLENAIGDERSLSTKHSGKVPEDRPSDDVGHGTKIAGIALYGDILNCINLKLFSPKIWIFSAKVMYKGQDGEAEYDERELYEHQLSRAIEWITTEYPNCKIINLSLGDSAQVFSEGIQQSNLATLIDELSREYGLIFIISAGNIDNGTFIELREEYPDYLIKECDKIRIIDPATSALALTVGAVYRYAKESQGTTFGYFPSRGTRVGPGYRRMIKPELVEEGGNGFGTESDIVTTNPNWINEGRLFTLDCGTSFSAPKVAHYAALLLNKYPGSSSNLIKALLLSSAVIPEEKPEELSGIDIAENDENFISIANIYGYGKPDLERASVSSFL